MSFQSDILAFGGILKRLIFILTVFSISACAPQNTAAPLFPSPRVDIYVIDSSISAVRDEENSTLKLFDRVQNKILTEISGNALGSPEITLDGKQIEGKKPVGFYLFQLTNRASDNEITQVKNLTGSEDIWNKVNSESYNLNSTNKLSLWNKLQLISSEIKDYGNDCEIKVTESLLGESVNDSEKKTLASMLCDETVGSLKKLNSFKEKIRNYVEETGGSPGSDIYGMLISINQWINTLEAKEDVGTKFNLILLSDMVHDADSEQDLNKILSGLRNEDAINLGKEKSKELNFNLNKNVDVYVVGIGAFGKNYQTDAQFTQVLTNYWKGFFGEQNQIFFTPSLDDVNLG